jgi:hypothetical protein
VGRREVEREWNSRKNPKKSIAKGNVQTNGYSKKKKKIKIKERR